MPLPIHYTVLKILSGSILLPTSNNSSSSTQPHCQPTQVQPALPQIRAGPSTQYKVSTFIDAIKAAHQCLGGVNMEDILDL